MITQFLSLYFTELRKWTKYKCKNGPPALAGHSACKVKAPLSSLFIVITPYSYYPAVQSFGSASFHGRIFYALDYDDQ